MKTYKDVYMLPLHVSHDWVRDEKHQFVFQFEDAVRSDNVQRQILGIINGYGKPSTQHHFIHENGYISEGGKNYILIRGWGNLTGTGGHNLSVEEAANIQDTFAEFIVNQLNQKVN